MELVHTAFPDRILVEDETWQSLVLIPKGGRYYFGIVIVEVVWKAMEVILNFRFTASITCHDYLHRFLAGRGTRKPTLKVKLLQKFTTMR